MPVSKEHEKVIQQAISSEDVDAIKTLLQEVGDAKVLQDYYVAIITAAYDQGTAGYFRSILNLIQSKDEIGFQNVFSKRLFCEVAGVGIYICNLQHNTEYLLPLWVLFHKNVGAESRRIVEPPHDFKQKLNEMLQCFMAASTDKQNVLIKLLFKRIYENMNACVRNTSTENPEATQEFLVYLTHILNIIMEAIGIEKFRSLYTEVARKRERFLLAAIYKYDLTILHLLDRRAPAIPWSIIQYCFDALNPDITRFFAGLSQNFGHNGTLTPPNLVGYFVCQDQYILACTYAKIIGNKHCLLKANPLKSLLDSGDMGTLSKLESQFKIDWDTLIKQLDYPPNHVNIVMYFYDRKQRNVVNWLANKIDDKEFSRMLHQKDLRGYSAWDIHQQDPTFWHEELNNNNNNNDDVKHPQILSESPSTTETPSPSKSTVTTTSESNNEHIEARQRTQERSIQMMREQLRQQSAQITKLLDQQRDSQLEMATLVNEIKNLQADKQMRTQQIHELSIQCAEQLRMFQALMPSVPKQGEDEKEEKDLDNNDNVVASTTKLGITIFNPVCR